MNLVARHLVFGKLTWVPAWPFLGLDFLHNYLAVHHLMRGGNPYTQLFGDDRGTYAYPPLVLALFAWTALFPPRTQYAAVVVWTTAVAALLAVGAWACVRARRAMRLWDAPWPLAAVVVLWSTPAVFAMERANCDVIVLGMILLAAAAVRRKSGGGDFVAGACLAVAMWTKIYPGLLVLASPALGRWRVSAWAVAAGLVIALVPLPATRAFFRTAGSSEGYRTKFLQSAIQGAADPDKAESGVQSYPPLEEFSHSLPIYWRTFWTGAGLSGVGRVPGMFGAAIVLGPALAWAFSRVRSAPDPAALAYPYFLLVALAATFWMPVSYDYNLVYLPLLALAVWDVRDGPWVHAMMAPVLVYWQPLAQDVPKELLLLFKLLALYALTVCLSHRANEQTSGFRQLGEADAPAGLRKLPIS